MNPRIALWNPPETMLQAAARLRALGLLDLAERLEYQWRISKRRGAR